MEAVLLAVTLLSLAIALGASSLAWRVMRNERLRSEARIAALAADLGIEDDERPLHASRRAEPAEAVEIRTADEPIAAPAGMFAPKVRERSAFRFAAGIGVASLLVAAVIGTPGADESRNDARSRGNRTAAAACACVCARGRAARTDRAGPRARGRSPDGARRRARRRTGARAGSAHRRGVAVRSRGNAASAAGAARSSGAEADPAGERTFVVTVNSAGNVGRYRISFRSDDHIVPHVDRRAQPGTLSSDAGTAKSQV